MRAARPSCPSFRTVTVWALITVSMLIEGWISKKESVPGFATSSASIRLPPNWPTEWRSRRPGRCTTKRATSFASR